MITVVDGPAETLVRVDGWLAGDGVAELERALDAAATPARLLVDQLRGADDAGLAVLRRLVGRGTPLDGLSTYLRLMLANPASLGPNSETRTTRSDTSGKRREHQ
jgi:hypothetical protein